MLLENVNTVNNIMKFTLARSVVQLIIWGVPCHYSLGPPNAIFTILYYEISFIKIFKFLCHIINYIQQERGKHKKFNHACNNFSQQ